MTDQGQNAKAESNATEEVFEVTEEHIKNLLTYICNLSSAVIDADPEKVTSLFSSEQNKNLLKLFISEETSKIICIIKNDEETKDPSNEYIIEIEPTFKTYQNSTIIFIKRVPRLDCSKQRLIKRDIQMLNFIGGNDKEMFDYMLNCIQSAFSPLFTSFQKTLRSDVKNASSKIEGCKDVNSKMKELAILLDKVQTNPEVFDVKLETHPLVKEKVEEYFKKNGKYPTAEEIKPLLDDKTINKLLEMINKWKADILAFTSAENDLSKGDSLDEINFWKKAEITVNDIRKQIKSPENQIMYELAKMTKKMFAINSLEDELNLNSYANTLSYYNMNLKDIKIVDLLQSSTLAEIPSKLEAIFDNFKSMINSPYYPKERKPKLLEKIKQDLIKLIIKLLGNSLMTIPYEEFCDICTQLEFIFQNSWKNQLEKLKSESRVRTSSNSEFNFNPSLSSNPFQLRMEELKKMRDEHKNFLELSQNLILSEQNESAEEEKNDNNNFEMKKEIEEAYQEFSKVDILDLSGKGEKNWIEAKERYNKKMEEIENKISGFLKEQLETEKNSSEQYKIFKRFQFLSQRQRIHLGLKEYQSAFIEKIKAHLSELLDTLLAGYNNNTASKMSKIKKIPEMSGNYIWLKQFERKANSLKEKVRVILGDNWENVNEGKKIKELIESIKKNSDSKRLLERFNKETVPNNNNDMSNERLLNIVKKQNGYEIKVNFDEKLIEKFKEFRMLSDKTDKNSSASFIKGRLIDYKLNYSNAMALQESFKAFHNSCNKIANDSVIDRLVAQQKRDILSLVNEKYTHTWGNLPKIPEFILEISEKVSTFEETVNDLIVRVSKIDSLLSQIENSDFTDNKELVNEKIKNIQNLLDEIKGCSNMAKWIYSIDAKLQKILIKKLEDCTELWIKEFLAPKPLTDAILLQECSIHKVIKSDQLIYLEPSLNDAREFWYNEYHKAISFILQCNHLQYNPPKSEKDKNRENNINIYRDNSFRDIIKEANQKIILGCYTTLEKTIDEVEEYMKDWKSYRVLWEIQPKTIYDKLGNDTIKWQALMLELKRSQGKFNTDETEKIIGSIVVDFSSVKKKVRSKYNAWHREVMDKFAEITNEGMKQFNSLVNEARTNLESNSLENEGKDIISFITEINKFTENEATWKLEMNKFKNSKQILDNQKYSINRTSKKRQRKINKRIK